MTKTKQMEQLIEKVSARIVNETIKRISKEYTDATFCIAGKGGESLSGKALHGQIIYYVADGLFKEYFKNYSSFEPSADAVVDKVDKIVSMKRMESIRPTIKKEAV